MSKPFSPYATPSATREVLERHGLYTKYALGQNFLVNDDVVRKIIELANIQPTDTVLEIGPGIGTLSYALASHARHVIAIEKDSDLPAVLSDTLCDFQDRFTLISMDALDVTASDIEHSFVSADADASVPNKLVSNLPYAVAATIVLDYLERFDFLESSTVMVQKEVADRMTAQPGAKAYGAYTVKLSLYAQPAGRFAVAAGNFFPPPHVESAVLRLNRSVAKGPEGNLLSPDELTTTCRMADAAFANRRKTLMNSCKTYFASDTHILEMLPTIFAKADIDPKRRGETLTHDEFIRLGVALSTLPKM